MDGKTCTKCGEFKPLFDYHQRKDNKADGRRADCIVCVRERKRVHLLKNKARINRKRRAHYDANKAEIKPRLRAYYRANKGKVSAGVRRWESVNPEKKLAHRAVAYAKRCGELVPQPCEVCGLEKVEAHHDDYSKPLDVRWLCRTHHRQWHRENDPITPPEPAALE